MRTTRAKDTVLPAALENLQNWIKKAGERKPIAEEERSDVMGKVAISLKVNLAGPEVDIEKLKEAIKEKIEVEDMQEIDIGFGLKALRIMVVRPDAEGQGTDDLENTLSEIEGVASVEVEGVTLI